MPKQCKPRSAKPSALYNHNTRKLVARQLNISHNVLSGRSSYSYVSSQVRMRPRREPPLPPPPVCAEQELDVAEVGMDINADYMFDVDDGADQPVMPAITKPDSEERYENSASLFGPILNDDLHALQDVPLKTWVRFRDDYLDECMFLEGRGTFHSSCAGCHAPMPQYRCKDCTLGPLWCRACLLQRHDQLPLHLVEVCVTLPFPVVFSF